MFFLLFNILFHETDFLFLYFLLFFWGTRLLNFFQRQDKLFQFKSDLNAHDQLFVVFYFNLILFEWAQQFIKLVDGVDNISQPFGDVFVGITG